VIFVTGSLAHGGAERHAVAVMNRMGERGHQCHAVYIKNEAALLDSIRLNEGGTVQCLNAARYFDRRALTDFAAHISRIKPSVVVAANPYALLYSTLALRIARLQVPQVVTYHSTWLLGVKERLQMLVYRPFFWISDCSVFVCEMQRRYCMRRGVFARRNEVIHNGVDTNRFRDTWSPDERGRLRRALGYTDADYVIGIAATLRAEKNHAQLVDALARLRGMGIAARVLMIGDGDKRAEIEARARELRVERDITITGFQREVRPYVAACDVMTLCSHTEAFSLAAIEAMSLGKPVVHSDVGGAAEMVFSGWNGFLFPAGDTADFVDKLAILSDRAVSARMGHNARGVAEKFFSEKTMVDRYEETLLDLCGVPANTSAKEAVT